MKDFRSAGKKAQLKRLSAQLNWALATTGNESLISQLLEKIRLLVAQLSQQLGRRELKRILGVAALLFGMGSVQNANAQYFVNISVNPYGLISTDGFSIPSFVDLDNDGDFDIVAGEGGGNFEYFQNVGSIEEPDFSAPVYNPFGLKNTEGLAVPTFADLDNDGDFDLIAGERYGALEYFENIGTADNPSFKEAVKNPFGLTSTYYNSFPAFVDFDGDGDQDLLVGEYTGNFQYFENIGSIDAPEYAPVKENPFGLKQMVDYAVPGVADVDLDGDIDLLVGIKSGFVEYFENKGSSTEAVFENSVETPFGIQQVLELAFPAFADLDGDGDDDLLIGEDKGKMHFYENTIISSIADARGTPKTRFFPNPVQDYLIVQTGQQIASIEVFNTMGQLVISEKNGHSKISLGTLEAGVYVVRMHDLEGNLFEQRIQKL